MKPRKLLLAVLTASSMLLANSLLAQDQSMTSPPPAPIAPVQSSTAGSAQDSAQLNTPQGQLVVHSTVPPVAAGPAPSFEQLSGGARYITVDQASAYPLLANDFTYVDRGKTGHISKAQYEHWLSNK